ncbi:hypothetical protein GW17_00051170 [Ensete ventricosum]|nr:hypothetical protein GW17_00051170 [Ensete ventricosum]
MERARRQSSPMASYKLRNGVKVGFAPMEAAGIKCERGVSLKNQSRRIVQQAFTGLGPCALARPPCDLLWRRVELVRMSGDSGLDSKRAFIVGVVDHSYLITLLPLWLIIPPYPPTMLAVLAMRRAFTGGGCRPYMCQVCCTSTGAPGIFGRSPASGRPRRRASCPRV